MRSAEYLPKINKCVVFTKRYQVLTCYHFCQTSDKTCGKCRELTNVGKNGSKEQQDQGSKAPSAVHYITVKALTKLSSKLLHTYNFLP